MEARPKSWPRSPAFTAVTLQPAAGSQGELTGLMLLSVRHSRGSREGEQRDTIITADTAHETKPASVTMAGYGSKKVATTERGNLNLDDLRLKVNERTAGLMLTNHRPWACSTRTSSPSQKSLRPARYLYYDGANLNAVHRQVTARRNIGFDIVHYNLHNITHSRTAAVGRAVGRSQ